ncbi:MAG: hypothetical protein PHR35_08910 [Kiritimatiellae bacterium]|nr:hypothetical protein [Kiritimatiellia bacterium]
MTFEVLLYSTAFVATMLSVLVAGYAFLFHRREFWKIAEWETMRRDARTLEGLRQQVVTAQAQIDALSAALADANETLRRASSAKAFLDGRPTLEAERDALEKTLGDLAEKTRAAIEERAGLEQRRDQLTAELANWAAQAEETRKLAGRFEDLTHKVRDSEAQLSQLVAQTTEAQTKMQDLVTKAKGMEDALAKAKEALAITEQLAAKARMEAEVNQSMVGELKKEKQALEESIQRLRQLLDVVGQARSGEVVLRQSSFVSLVQDPPFEKPKQDTAAEESTALRQLKAYVKETKGFDIPDRMLLAFHTALKTSDISCLTVMAGVSGTGKSRLPEMYARAMGIHFVTLAVEPRWDSPKDLLGFFNYVTNRYEATPMARALFQFGGRQDPKGIRAIADTPDLRDYMLMILLDEMNLARIEYYFSEFLSKLEMRRAGSLDDREHLRQVSMEVFAGYQGKTGKDNFVEPAIRLFADYNTLFVGTMNEDETTQSLSDKVIDRANVLHFGRPLQLRARTNGGAQQQPRSAMLRRDRWVNWQRVVNEVDHTSARKTLSELNAQLDILGRPFAHRTFQAMLQYIANYPVDPALNPAGSARPLADQIAMRIMPKLRGLDLSQQRQALDAVGGIVNGVDDKALSNAFQQAKDPQQNRSGFFLWRGLDWTAQD